jgi:hypothetical protein
MAGAEHGAPSPTRTHHGQSEKETSSEDEQAQAPKALEGESPQKAHVAEVSGAPCARPRLFPVLFPKPAADRGGFFVL